MFDYVFFIKWTGLLSSIFFGVRLLDSICSWYYYKHTRSGELEKIDLAIKGQEILGFGTARNILFFCISILLYFSVKQLFHFSHKCENLWEILKELKFLNFCDSFKNRSWTKKTFYCGSAQ